MSELNMADVEIAFHTTRTRESCLKMAQRTYESQNDSDRAGMLNYAEQLYRFCIKTDEPEPDVCCSVAPEPPVEAVLDELATKVDRLMGLGADVYGELCNLRERIIRE